jgi:hypothetical protein
MELDKMTGIHLNEGSVNAGIFVAELQRLGIAFYYEPWPENHYRVYVKPESEGAMKEALTRARDKSCVLTDSKSFNRVV